MPHTKSSLYPVYPNGTRILASTPELSNISKLDRFLVYFSSLLFVGSVVWVPSLAIYSYKKWKKIPKEDTRKRRLYGSILLSIAIIALTGPHRSKKVGEWFGVRKWRLWKAWLNYIAYEVITDVDYSQFLRETTNPSSSNTSFDVKNDPAILALIPHGVFPFSIAFAAMPEVAQNAFGIFRPVVATATAFFPYVNMFLSWLGKVDASRSAVNQALAAKHRIGLAPGGISEMFEGYPKPPCTHINDECTLIQSRKGFIKMSIQHQTPVIPVFCFGASKMLKRVNLPILEKISNIIRVSLCIFYGMTGLPIPFRQRLLYVMGSPIFPPSLADNDNNGRPREVSAQQVNKMHEKFCNELIRIFDKYKVSYGWDEKTLQLI